MPSEAGTAATRLTIGCKINLFLRITGRRDDGYHTLESLFFPLSRPFDVLTVTRAERDGLAFSSSDKTLAGPDNLVVKAYTAFVATTSYKPGLTAFLEKGIPYGAGLGGGSADAAALLLHLNKLAREETGQSLTNTELQALGARLGADVPFFFRNRPSLVRGIGDVLEPVSVSLAGLHLVLVCPKIHVATAWAFKAWDEKHGTGILTNGVGEDTSPLVRGIQVQNDLCPIVFERYPALRDVFLELQRLRADAVSMSGSGASIFGIFLSERDAIHAARFFHDKGERVFHHIL